MTIKEKQTKRKEERKKKNSIKCEESHWINLFFAIEWILQWKLFKKQIPTKKGYSFSHHHNEQKKIGVFVCLKKKNVKYSTIEFHKKMKFGYSIDDRLLISYLDSGSSGNPSPIKKKHLCSYSNPF